jgi:hypothetical protein
MKGLLFSAPMMIANLAGTKTETRRMPKKSGKPRFTVGELGYAQEAWRTPANFDERSPSQLIASCLEAGFKSAWSPIHFEADGTKLNWVGLRQEKEGRLRASMHLPEAFTRFKFRVVDCEFQNLHDITEEQAIAEGVIDCTQYYKGAPDLPPRYLAVEAYRSLWEHLNDEWSWVSNPKIERIRYERIPL